MRVLVAAIAAIVILAPGVASAARVAVEIDVTGAGYQRSVTVHVTRGGRPVRGAGVVVSAVMRHPGHEMVVAPRPARQVQPGVYRATLTFLMLGQWRVLATVDGATHATVVRL